MGQSVYVVAGEVSGDIHAAELITALKGRVDELEVSGLGGPETREAVGEAVEDWLEFAAVMGVWEVLKHYKAFKKRMEDCVADIVAKQPKLLLLVDYPGFNLRLAKRVKEQAPNVKVVQYVCPQVWAWKKGRIPKIAEVVDLLICLFPFEPKYFADYDLKTVSLGHPVIDELTEAKANLKREEELIGLFPGSREREVARIFPTMIETARRLSIEYPELRYEAPAASAKLAEQMRELIEQAHLPVNTDIKVTDGGSHSLMQRAMCGMVASGTATLEAAFFGLPHCIVYKLAWSTFAIAKLVVKIEHIGIVNILAGKTVVEEFIQGDAEPGTLKRVLRTFVENPQKREEQTREMQEVVSTLGAPGVHNRIADELVGMLYTDGRD